MVSHYRQTLKHLGWIVITGCLTLGLPGCDFLVWRALSRPTLFAALIAVFMVIALASRRPKG
jgi:hypothetical protein